MCRCGRRVLERAVLDGQVTDDRTLHGIQSEAGTRIVTEQRIVEGHIAERCATDNTGPGVARRILDHETNAITVEEEVATVHRTGKRGVGDVKRAEHRSLGSGVVHEQANPRVGISVEHVLSTQAAHCEVIR